MSQRKDDAERVVITGLGVVTSIGLDVENFWTNLQTHYSAASLLPKPFIGRSGAVGFAGQIDEESLDLPFMSPKELRRMHRSQVFSLKAGYEALTDADLLVGSTLPESLQKVAGVQIGTGFGGADYLREVYRRLEAGLDIDPFSWQKVEPEQVAAGPSSVFKIRGPVRCLVAACATGNENIGAAYDLIKNKQAIIMLAGSTEGIITDAALAVYEIIRALRYSPKGTDFSQLDPSTYSRPFDLERDGFVPSEGAGIVVLERLDHAKERGAKIYVEISGYGSTADGDHLTLANGEGSERAMRLALANAGLTIKDIDYIKAHGTATKGGDLAELGAISRLTEGLPIPVSSLKGLLLHNLGAAGSIEVVAVIKMIHEGILIPNFNLDNPEPTPQVNLSSKPPVNIPYPVYLLRGLNQKRTVRHALSNAFGFGGINNSLVISAFED